MPENEPSPLSEGEIQETLVRNLDDPDVREKLEQLRQDYRKFCKAHERNFEADKKKFRKRGPEYCRTLEAAKQTMLRFEKERYQLLIKQLLEATVNKGK